MPKVKGFRREPREKESRLFAITRDIDYKSKLIYSDDNRFTSERNFSHAGQLMFLFASPWLPDRYMEEKKLFISEEVVKSKKFSQDYSRLPKDLTDILDQGILRTSGTTPTNYSILMSVAYEYNRPPEGRTGVLLYKGQPLQIDINGIDFIVEIKGVGCPDGNNNRTVTMPRSGYFGTHYKEYGGLEFTEGTREYSHLEIQRKRKSSTFMNAESVRSAALFSYEKEKTFEDGKTKKISQAYLLRLAPTNIRSSFNTNPDFPKIEDREMLLSTSIGEHYAELAKLKETLLHSTIHPENILWTGKRYVLTDFADCRKLEHIDRPHDFLNKVLDTIVEVPGLTEQGANNFYFTLAKGLGVDWDVKTGYNGFISSIWSGYFAQKTYSIRKGKTKNADKTIAATKSLIWSYRSYLKDKPPLCDLFINGVKHFLEEEVDMLTHVDTPDAVSSLNIAKERIDYLTGQIKNTRDINAKFKQNPESFYDLLVLPYMIK